MVHQVKGHLLNLLNWSHLRMVTSDNGLIHLISFSAGQQLVRAITQVRVPDLARLILVIGGCQIV